MTTAPRGGRRVSLLLAFFAVAAFAQTLFYYAYLRDDPGNYNGAGATGDQVAYIALAQDILQGRWDGAMHYMPGYPAVLALGQAVFGDAWLGAAVIQGLVYALLVVGAWRLAGEVFGPATRAWAAGFVALNPALGAYAGQALTEFLTAALAFLAAILVYRWAATRRVAHAVGLGLATAAMVYLRSEYLAFALVLAAILAWIGWRRGFPRLALAHGLVLGVVLLAAIAPWAIRYQVATGRLTLYNESPVSNLILMGTWFRVFDEQTWAQLQEIAADQTAPREELIARAGRVGPQPELSARYMAQNRGPYERPLGETLALAAENVRLTLPRYLVNHFVLAPVLIWGGRTPIRQADMTLLPSSLRWLLWGIQLALVALALWQAARTLRDARANPLSLAFLGLFLFLTAVHLFIGVDERFTVPALPLIQLYAGVAVGRLVTREKLAVDYARA